MGAQGWMVLGAAALAVLGLGRKLFRNLGRAGRDAGCCCGGGGGACGKGRTGAPRGIKE